MTNSPSTLARVAHSRRPFVQIRKVMYEYLGLILVLAGLIILFSILSPHFFTRGTFINIANQIPSVTIVTIGMTYVLIIAGIDLSVGSVLALCSAVVGVLMVQKGAPYPVVALAAIGVGLACGLFNGVVTVAWALPSFIVTLGMMEIARGGTHYIAESRTQYIGSAAGFIASTPVLGLALHFYIAIAAVICGQFVLSRTVFGRYMVAVGTNEEAVRLSGVDPRPVKIAVFAVTGMLVALAALIDTAIIESADPNMGNGLELKAIAAAVIGGTSLMGGRGSVIRSFLGVLIIQVLSDGLVQLGAGDQTKRIVTGFVIIAAAVLDFYRRRWSHRIA